MGLCGTLVSPGSLLARLVAQTPIPGLVLRGGAGQSEEHPGDAAAGPARPGRGGGAGAPAVSDRGRGAGTATPAPWGAWEWEFRATRTASTSPCAQTRHKIPLGSLAELCRSANVKRGMGGDLGTPRLRDPGVCFLS